MHLGRSWIRATRLLNIDYPWWLSSETKLTPPDRNLDSDSRPNSFMNIIYPNLDEELNKPNLEGSLQSSSNVPSDCHCSQSRENAPTNSLHQRASMWLFAQTGNFEFLLIFIFIVLCCLERNNCSLSFWVLMSLHHGHRLELWWYTLSCLLTARTAIVCDLKLFLRLRTLSSLLDGLFVLSPGGWGFALTRQFLWILFLTGYIPVYWVYEKIKFSKAIHIIRSLYYPYFIIAPGGTVLRTSSVCWKFLMCIVHRPLCLKLVCFIAHSYSPLSRQVFHCATCRQDLCFPSFVIVGESPTTFRERWSSWQQRLGKLRPRWDKLLVGGNHYFLHTRQDRAGR